MSENVAKENRMGTEAVGKLLFKMAIPMIASMMVQALYNIVDSMYVSMINESALTAVSISFPMQNLIISIGSGTSVGVNALLSKSLGEKKIAQASQIASNGILLALISGVSMAVLGIFIVSPFIATQSAGSSSDIYEYGITYLGIVCTFSIFLFSELMFERLLNSTGKTSYTMISQMIGAGINIFLDPVLIFGYFGLPKMGVAGAATATVTGQGIAAIVALILNLKKNNDISLRFKDLKIDVGIVKNIYKIGIPSIVMMSVTSVMTFGMNIILNSFSSTATAVLGVYTKMNSIIFFPIFGMNNAIVPIVAFNYGAQKKSRIKRTMLISIIMGMSIMTIGLILFWTIPDKLLLLFNASENMLDIGVIAFHTISLSFIPAGYCIITGSVLQALGDAFLSMINSLARQLLILLPAAYILSKFFGLDAIWWSFPIAEILSVTMLTIFFKYVYKKKIAPMPN